MSKGPEFSIAAKVAEHETSLQVTPSMGMLVDQAYASIMREVVEQGLPEWCAEPKHIWEERLGPGETRTTIEFANSTHFGSFREIYAGNGLRILRDMLEDDGASVSLDEKAEELIDGKPGQREIAEKPTSAEDEPEPAAESEPESE
ncbi:MAG TPA: hypothetical protein VFW77_03840 [Candidatus Saccharimonadales bacterium]|nr:hypothetical protein [Candidatus Saccharimonadales bacterium]